MFPSLLKSFAGTINSTELWLQLWLYCGIFYSFFYEDKKITSYDSEKNGVAKRPQLSPRGRPKREQMRQLPEFMMLTGLETRDFEAAEREDLQALISTLPIEKVRQLIQ